MKGGTMLTDKKRIEILSEFINQTTVAKGGNIQVTITDHCVSMENALNKNLGMRYEDMNYLSEVLKGAEQFLYYLQRNDLDVVKRKNAKASK